MVLELTRVLIKAAVYILYQLNMKVTFIDRYDMDTRRKIREISDDLKRFSSNDPVSIINCVCVHKLV